MTYEQVVNHKKDPIEHVRNLEYCPKCGRTLMELDLNAPNGIINDKNDEFPSLRCTSCGFVIAPKIY